MLMHKKDMVKAKEADVDVDGEIADELQEEDAKKEAVEGVIADEEQEGDCERTPQFTKSNHLN